MNLEHPLINLINKCQSLFVAECCGIGAFDFSPVHIASFLIMWEGKPRDNDLRKLRAQLDELKRNYGLNGAISPGVAITELNQYLSGKEIDILVDEISYNLKLALQICEQAERDRFGSTEQIL